MSSTDWLIIWPWWRQGKERLIADDTELRHFDDAVSVSDDFVETLELYSTTCSTCFNIHLRREEKSVLYGNETMTSPRLISARNSWHGSTQFQRRSTASSTGVCCPSVRFAPSSGAADRVYCRMERRQQAVAYNYLRRTVAMYGSSRRSRQRTAVVQTSPRTSLIGRDVWLYCKWWRVLSSSSNNSSSSRNPSPSS